MRELLRITIIVQSDGALTTTGAAGVPETRPQCQPAAPDPSSRDLAVSMLADAAVREPESLLQLYTPERIIAVCVEAGRRKGTLRNPGGWINRALRQGWCK
jgi:hypothetical protein